MRSSGGDDVDVANAGDGVDRALAAEDDPALIDQRLVEPAAEHLHGQKAVGRDAPDHAAELVHVGVDHDARACALALARPAARSPSPCRRR